MATESDSISNKDRYEAAVMMVTSSETTSLNRFNAYLLFAAVITAGWIQILVTGPDATRSKLVMSLLAALGIVSSIYFAGLGSRSRRFLEHFRRIGEAYETAHRPGDPRLDPMFAAGRFPESDKRDLRTFLETHTGARNLFFYGPLFLAVIFFAFMLITWLA